MEEYELINKYEKLIYKIAKKFYNVEIEDLYQAGCIGLIKASRKYNENIGVNFMDFAYKYIFGEMYDLANKSRDIKLNKAYLKIYKKINEAKNVLINKNNKPPTFQELAEFLQIDETLISEVLTLTNKLMSLDDEYQTLNGDNLRISECIGEEHNYDEEILIKDSLEELDDIEQKVIKIRYFEDLTQMETAKALNMSQVKVSRIEQKSKEKIKTFISA